LTLTPRVERLSSKAVRPLAVVTLALGLGASGCNAILGLDAGQTRPAPAGGAAAWAKSIAGATSILACADTAGGGVWIAGAAEGDVDLGALSVKADHGLFIARLDDAKKGAATTSGAEVDIGAARSHRARSGATTRASSSAGTFTGEAFGAKAP